MNWITASVKRLFSRRSREAARADGGPSAAASDGVEPAHFERPPTERPGLDEWIRTFDLDKEKARLAEDKRHLAAENARLWSELIAKNARLDQTSKALLIAEQGLRGALDRETELIEVLLPNIEFLRDSREVLRIGLSSRRSALTALRDISARPDVVKGTRVQAADGWLERHFNTGDRPNGRIYYCYRGERCSVLVSFLFRSRLTRPPTSSIFRRCDPSWNAAAQTRSPNNSVQRPGIALLAQAVARAFGTQPIRLT